MSVCISICNDIYSSESLCLDVEFYEHYDIFIPLFFCIVLVFYEARIVVFFLIKETSLVSKVLIFNPILNKYLLNTDYTLGIY